VAFISCCIFELGFGFFVLVHCHPIAPFLTSHWVFGSFKLFNRYAPFKTV
jgi:hypothetical protein